METYKNYLAVAVGAARHSGKIFKANFGKPKHIKQKAGNYRDLVTEIDSKIEMAIKKEIFSHFPGHKILGEEFGWAGENGQGQLSWIIDPIDGTTNFIQGIPMCCISLALWKNNRPLLGVIYNPVTEQLYSAIKGQGAYLNGEKNTVSKIKNLKNAFGGVGWGRDVNLGAQILPYFLKTTKKIRVLGSAAWELTRVASGEYDFFIQGSVKIWDIAAGLLIVQEAGGKITDWRGKAPVLTTAQLLASNKAVHKEILKLLKNSSK